MTGRRWEGPRYARETKVRQKAGPSSHLQDASSRILHFITLLHLSKWLAFIASTSLKLANWLIVSRDIRRQLLFQSEMLPRVSTDTAALLRACLLLVFLSPTLGREETDGIFNDALNENAAADARRVRRGVYAYMALSAASAALLTAWWAYGTSVVDRDAYFKDRRMPVAGPGQSAGGRSGSFKWR